MYPIENYKIKFYGDGKIVALERGDVLGYPSLIGSYKEGDRNKSNWFYLYFHRPKAGGPLEVIR